MNIWECEHAHCNQEARGCMGAIGLRAIGWYFERGQGGSGPRIFCPRHRPDGPDCLGGCGETLPMIAANAEAFRWQRAMGSDIAPRETDEHTGFCADCCPRCSSGKTED